MSQSNSASILSTKQRIALGALAPTKPKAMPLPLPKPSLPLPGKANSALMALSFKKKPSVSTASKNGDGSGQIEYAKHDSGPTEQQTSSRPDVAMAPQTSAKVSPTTSLFSDVPHIMSSPTSVHDMQDQTENFEPYPETM
jgi:hypothetical protein